MSKIKDYLAEQGNNKFLLYKRFQCSIKINTYRLYTSSICVK